MNDYYPPKEYDYPSFLNLYEIGAMVKFDILKSNIMNFLPTFCGLNMVNLY